MNKASTRSYVMGDYLEVSNLNWLFLKLNRFICTYVVVTNERNRSNVKKLVVLLDITLLAYFSHMQEVILHLQSFSSRMTFAGMANLNILHLHLHIAVEKNANANAGWVGMLL